MQDLSCQLCGFPAAKDILLPLKLALAVGGELRQEHSLLRAGVARAPGVLVGAPVGCGAGGFLVQGRAVGANGGFGGGAMPDKGLELLLGRCGGVVGPDGKLRESGVGWEDG